MTKPRALRPVSVVATVKAYPQTGAPYYRQFRGPDREAADKKATAYCDSHQIPFSIVDYASG